MNHFFGESIPLIYRFIKNKSINQWDTFPEKVIHAMEKF